ncbi:MAG: hypothetical protein SF029_00965 [bacterium]|nr:hypothetical protein [bacterium]
MTQAFSQTASLFRRSRALRLLAVDVAFITVLLVLAGVPLILWRDTPWLENTAALVVVLVLWLIVCAGWLLVARREQRQLPAQPRAGSGFGLRRSFWEMLAVGGGFFLIGLIAFYLPVRQHYWIGMDEPVLMDAQNYLWYPVYDQQAGRPLAAIAAFVAGVLTPNSFEGWWMVSFGARLVSSLMMYAGMRLITPRGTMLPLLVGLLFLVNPAELSRFAVVFEISFYGGMIITVGAIFLFCLSYRYQWRWLLVVACILLAAALLHYEAIYFIALYSFALLLLMGWRRHIWTWSFAWGGVMALCALRLIVYFINASSYQDGYVSVIESQFTPAVAFQNFINLVTPIVSFITSARDVPAHWLPGVTAFFVSAALLWIATRRTSLTMSPRAYLIGIALGSAVLVLSVIAWVPIPIPPVPDLAEYPTLRYQFVAMLPQAALWALAIGAVGLLLPRRMQRLWGVFSVSLLVMFSTANSYALQARGGVWNPQVNWERVSGILRQVDAQMPDLPPGAVVFFALEPDAETPFGWTYHVHHLSCYFFGAPAYQGILADQPGWLVRGTSGNPPPPEGSNPWEAYQRFNLTNVVVFEIDREDNVRLLQNPPIPAPLEGAQNPAPCLVDQVEREPGQPLPYVLSGN